MIYHRDVEIIYIDETSFHLWQTPSRMWLKPGMKIELPNNRSISISMIGALSNRRGMLFQKTFAGSNNQDTFLDFILGLKAKMNGRCWINMDNLSTHKSKIVKDHFSDDFR